MRIGCLQFAPQVGDVDNNLNRADAVLSRANPDDLMLDLLVLPEMAFTGYNFKSLQDITPFLEPSGSGITSLWARTTALKYGCVVAAGYPEKVDLSPKWPTGPEYYNSAIVVNADGETVANYRKSFLYYTDETWALEGDAGFYDGFIPGLGNASIGICMDLNPYKFEAPWDAFEFALHILEAESNLVIVSMAWNTMEDRALFTRQPNEPHMDTLTYWLTRLEPLIRSENQDEIVVVFCNRSGIEDDVTYAGTSAVIGIHDGEVKVYGLLGRGDKELLVVDTSNPPHAKLVYRPESASETPAELERSNMPDAPPAADEQRGGQAGPQSKPQSRRDGGRPASATSPSESAPEEGGGLPSSPFGSRRHQAAPRAESRTSVVPSLPPDTTAPPPPSPRFSPTLSPPEPVASPASLGRFPQRTRDRCETRRAAGFAAPQHLDLASCEAEKTNIPTPSAPSPTPMTLRPRVNASNSSPGTQRQDLDSLDRYSGVASPPSEPSVGSSGCRVSTFTGWSDGRSFGDGAPYTQGGAQTTSHPSRSDPACERKLAEDKTAPVERRARQSQLPRSVSSTKTSQSGRDGQNTNGRSTRTTVEAAPAAVADGARSPRSRNRNRNLSHPMDPADFYREAQTIPIAASPSILDEGGDSPIATQHVDERSTLYGPASSRSYSTTNTSRSHSTTNTSGGYRALADHGAVPRRGRRPGPEEALAVPDGERESSADSTRNAILHSRRLRRRSSTADDGTSYAGESGQAPGARGRRRVWEARGRGLRRRGLESKGE